MSKPKNFMSRALRGEFLDPAEALDDAIDAWHAGPTGVAELPDWLGMTASEYKLWAEKPKSLWAILAARRYNRTVEQFVQAEHQSSMSLAARGGTREELRDIYEWLRQTRRI